MYVCLSKKDELSSLCERMSTLVNIPAKKKGNYHTESMRGERTLYCDSHLRREMGRENMCGASTNTEEAEALEGKE